MAVFVMRRNSRIPSADSIPQQVEDGLGRSGSATTLANHAGQQMTRETLHALSAVPRPRIVKGDQWVQRRKSDVPRGTQEYNYQHWLIQVPIPFFHLFTKKIYQKMLYVMRGWT